MFTDFITFLLQKIGTYIDPRILVQRIESGLEIPGLQNSLVKMMRDYNLQVVWSFSCGHLTRCVSGYSKTFVIVFFQIRGRREW